MALWQRLLGCASMLLSLNLPLQAAPLVVGGSDWRPFTWHDDQGELHGIAIEVARQVLDLAGVEAQLVSYPVNRLQSMLGRGEIDINFADSPHWNSVGDRQHYLFSIPYMRVQEHLYFLADHPARHDDVSQLNDLTIGMVRGYTYPLLDASFTADRLQRLETSQDTVLLSLLQSGRVDAVAMVDDLFDYLVTHNHLDASQFVRGPQLSDAPLVFKLQAEHADLLPRIDQAIRTLKQRGELARIRQAYLPAGQNLAGMRP